MVGVFSPNRSQIDNDRELGKNPFISGGGWRSLSPPFPSLCRIAGLGPFPGVTVYDKGITFPPGEVVEAKLYYAAALILW
jgi:hypothetical protein